MASGGRRAAGCRALAGSPLASIQRRSSGFGGPPRPRRAPSPRSGLAGAARFWQRDQGSSSKVLIIDPLEQPGAHAACNEFTPDGAGARTLAGYGGSQSIDTPSAYARLAADLLRDTGIEVKRFERYFDSGFNRRHGLEPVPFDHPPSDPGRDAGVGNGDDPDNRARLLAA